MELSIQSDEGNTVRLDVTGRIAQSEVSGDSDLLVNLLGPEVYSCNVLLNMSHAEFVDSSGVSWLLSSHQQFRDHGGRLIMHDVPPIVLNVFKVLRMNTLFDLAPSEKEAIRMIGEETA